MALFDVICKHVKPKNVHRDERSKEATTKIVGRKYKLAGNPLRGLGQFVFFIMTTRRDAYHRLTSIEVKPTDWINRNPQFASSLQGISYIDLTRHEVLTSKQVGYKILDSKNRLHRIAELPESKYGELRAGLVQLRRLRRPIAPEVTRLLVRSLEPLSSDLIRRLGI